MKCRKVNLETGKHALKQIRKALGMTQIEFAQAIGVGERTMRRYEAATTEPMLTLPQIRALQVQLRKLGLDFEDIPDDWCYPKEVKK